MRTAEINRKTNETDIALRLDCDGSGRGEINSGVGFLDHMLTLFAKHSGFDLEIKCKGDTFVDDHHSVEDIGIALGLALKEALGNKVGICRYGDALIQTAVDLSGRGFLAFGLEIPTEKVGNFDCELVEEFFAAFARSAELTIHIRQLAGKNSHHIIEGAFKSAARALRAASAADPRFSDALPSTKGVL